MNLALVMAGGALGAALRFFLSIRFNDHILFLQNPGILIANGTGCLLLGVFNNSTYSDHPLKYFFSVGLLGALTTFSTFIAEAFSINQKNNIGQTILFMLIHLCIGIILYKLGLSLGKLI